MSLKFYCEDEFDKNKEISIDKFKHIFLNYEKNTPSLSEALYQMYHQSLGIDEIKINQFINEIIEKCKERIDPEFDILKIKYNNITIEDAYIICSYTCETKIKGYSPYKLLNINLNSEDRKNSVRNVSKYLYILLKALRKLPRYYPKDKYLYRCLTQQVNISQEKNEISSFIKGNKKIFWGFTSTSPDPKTTYSFLKKDDVIKTGTVFTLGGDIWGYDIELFNYYYEPEILLEPEIEFIIDNILPPLNGVINITCTVVKSNLISSDNKDESYILSNSTFVEKENNINKINEYVIKFEIEAKINEEKKYISGLGILYNIPSKKIKAFITYNHLMKFDFLNKGEKMMLYINHKEKEINIKLFKKILFI